MHFSQKFEPDDNNLTSLWEQIPGCKTDLLPLLSRACVTCIRQMQECPRKEADTAFNDKPDNGEESSCFRETWVLLKHSELRRHLVFALLSVQLQVIIQPPSSLCFCSVWIEKCPNKNPCIVSGLYAWKELNKLHLEWSKWSIFLTVLLVDKGWCLKTKFYHYQCYCLMWVQWYSFIRQIPRQIRPKDSYLYYPPLANSSCQCHTLTLH